jgi:Zn-dependent protease with chaperone function/tetratricopeptide (TPR) repeat protein
MFGLLPLLFAIVIAESATHTVFQSSAGNSWTWLLSVVGVSVVGWLIVGEIMAHMVGRRGKRSWLHRWDLLVQTMIIIWYGVLCYVWGWSAHSHNFISIALAPWVIMQIAHWWVLTPAVRMMTGHPWTRIGMVLQQLRFGILPMLLILPCFDIGTFIAQRYDLERAWFSGPMGPLLVMFCSQLFMVAALMILPLLLLPLWGARRMPDGDMADMMRQACERMGVRIAGLMRWPIPGGRVYNAAVIGFIPRLRYVLFTEDLMRDLPRNQVMAVLGHELGHARHGHLWMYFLFANASLLCSFLIREPLANLILPDLTWIASVIQLDPEPSDLRNIADISATLGLMAVMWRLVFGLMSRACERQADLVGAELAGDPLVMCDALKSVARLSGHGETEPSWRHYSIAERVAFLRDVHHQPSLAHQHHQRIRMLRHSLILIIIALLLATSYLFDPSRAASSSDPQAVLAEWSQKDHDLAQALLDADNGNHVPLGKWLNRAENEYRMTLGYLVLRQIEVAIGTDHEGDQRFDDRPVYRYRHRLRPFFDVSVGSENNGPQLERELDNTLAYGLVAGTESPTEFDLQTARLVVPRLEKAVIKQPQHAVYDTIGCVYFALGDFAKAVPAFESAMKLFNEDKSLTDFTWFASDEFKRKAGKTRAHLQMLYSSRLDAARANLASIQSGNADAAKSLLALPRDLGQPHADPTNSAPSAAIPLSRIPSPQADQVVELPSEITKP